VLRTKPLRSSTFRLTLAYLGLFSLSSAIILAAVYLLSVRFVDGHVRQTINEEVAWLLDQSAYGGVRGLQRLVEERSEAEPNKRAMFVLADPIGRPIAGNLSGLPDAAPDDRGFIDFPVEIVEDGRRLAKSHTAKARLIELPGGYRLLVGRDTNDLDQTQRLMRAAIFAGVGAIIVLGLLGGLILSRWMLMRLERINRSTAEIMAGELGRRITTDGNGDEFDELAQNLNAMLERIDRLLAGMRQVSEDIAHDLRTPLSRMRSRIEVALMGVPTPEDSRALLEETLADADRLIETFNALLAIARAEAGAQHADWERLDLAELARDVAELYEPLAEEAEIAFRLDAGEGAIILGHRQLVAQAIANVTDNAIKYTPRGGAVTITTSAKPAPQVTVADTGSGIPPELREHAKQRFVRLDAQRTTPGSGLGLSLVEAVAKLHDARLTLADNQPGLRLTLTFKPAPATRAEPAQAMAA
jgi:signal transduction histidine kinase